MISRITRLTEDVDVAFYYGRGKWSGLHCDKLHTEYLIPVCSPLLLDGKKPLNKPEDLANHMLLHDTSRRDWKRWFKSTGIKGVNVNHGPIFSHSTMALQAATHGQGIALAQNILAEELLNTGRLVNPFGQALIGKNAFYLVCREHQADVGKIQAFRDWVLNTVSLEEENVEYEEILK